MITDIKTWSDDHLPCVSFKKEGVLFMVWWTEGSLIGKLELVADGDVALEVALKKHPTLLTILANPFDTETDEDIDRTDERDIDGDLSYNTPIGMVTVHAREYLNDEQE